MTTLSRLMSAARESLEGGDALPIEEQAEALQDTGLTSEIIEEVQAPAAELDQGLNDVAAADAEADGLDNTAEILNDSVADGGQGVDPAAAELAANQIQAAAERFSLAHACARPARESFATSAGRRGATLSLAREAEEASKSLRERAIAAIKKAVEWLKDLVKSAFDKAHRVGKRAKALAEAARAQNRAGGFEGGKELKINGAFLGGKEPIEVARGIAELPAGLKELASAVTDGGAATKDAINLNPKEVGGVAMRVEFSDKATFVKEAGTVTDAEPVKSLGSSECSNVAGGVAHSLGKLIAAKNEFDALTKNSLSLIGALKTDGSAAERAQAASTVSAVTRAAGAVLSLGLHVSSRLLDVVDASLKAKEKTKDAAEPAGAAA